MTKIQTLLQLLVRDERRVAAAMRKMAELHPDEHDIFHVARELATWSDEHLTSLTRVGPRFGVEPPSDGPANGATLLDETETALRDHVGDDVDEGFLMLRQLRALHLVCVGLSVDWEMLAQTAKATRDDELLALAERCQQEAVRQMKWANSRLKEAAPQVMASR